MRVRSVRPLATVALVVGLVGAPQLVHADTVSNAEARVQQVLDALYALQDQMNKLDVGFGNAQDQKASVDADIDATQKRVDALQAQVGGVQEVLQNLAVTRFTSGASTALSPLFNDAATYSNAEQRDALGRLALDTGETRIDDLQAVMSQLGKQQVHLQRMHSKAKNLIGMARMVVEQYDGEVPTELDDLVRLPGVGRKTGNVLRSVAFDLPGLPVDTHVGRLSRRLDLTREEDPVKVEHELNRLVPPEERGRFSLRLILHGRRVCPARRPRCGECALLDVCPEGSRAHPGAVA